MGSPLGDFRSKKGQRKDDLDGNRLTHPSPRMIDRSARDEEDEEPDSSSEVEADTMVVGTSCLLPSKPCALPWSTAMRERKTTRGSHPMTRKILCR